VNREEITMDTVIPPRTGVAAVPRRTTVRCRPVGRMKAMAKIPDSTKSSLHRRLNVRARERWPQIERINTRYRAGFAYVDAVLSDADVLPLCRLRYANSWGFAIYRASHNDYQDVWLPAGSPGGTAEDALDTSCGLYLADPTAWT
jgi:hypothetical protein